LSQAPAASAPPWRALQPLLQQACGDVLTLRAETEHDRDFVAALYADMRAAELAPVDWPDEAKQAFLRDQYRLQHDHYRKHYVGAEFLLIELDGAAAGRLYLHRTRGEIRVMDIALLQTCRGRGIGTRLVHALLAIADADGCQLTLHVEPDNPVKSLYQRCGLTLIEERGAYHFMGREPQTQLNTAS